MKKKRKRSKDKPKTLHQQAYDRLLGKLRTGESKRKAREKGEDKKYIYSFSTFKSYLKHANYFMRYVHKTYPECINIDDAKQYVNEWLELRTNEGKSAWTLHLESKALGKLYDISEEDEDYFKPKQRNRVDIIRSRKECTSDVLFNEETHKEFVDFCKGTGLRRRELKELKGGMVVDSRTIEKEILNYKNIPRDESINNHLRALRDTRLFNETYFVHVTSGAKGGRERYSPIIGEHSSEIISRIQNKPHKEKVFEAVFDYADIHSYRAVYATDIYNLYKRDIDWLIAHKQEGDLYYCRKDEKGKVCDKKAMLRCSKALGHNRLQIVAENYIRGI